MTAQDCLDFIDALANIPPGTTINVTKADTPSRVGRYLTWRSGLSGGVIYFVGKGQGGAPLVELVGP